MRSLRVFHYIESLDAFIVTEQYSHVADTLGLSEWTPVVWIGRLFLMDNDFGEHWFDNWEQRQALAQQAAALGLDENDLLVVFPERFQDGRDGPCNTPELRKRFWTDVLKSLELSYDLLFEAARASNEQLRQHLPDECIQDLEERIAALRAKVG